MKVLILMVYYDRPNMVENALESIKNQTSDNYEVAFIDDGSTIPGKPIVEKILNDKLEKIKFYNSNDSIQSKLERGGSIHGKYMNIALEESTADIAIILCDDDALIPDYIENLSNYFKNNPEKKYCYSHVIPFDPTKQKPSASLEKSKFYLNKTGEFNPSCQVDSSQVAWRRQWALDNNIKFPFPQTGALDAHFYQMFYNKAGNCTFTGFIGQYKAIFRGQLGNQNINTCYYPADSS